MYINPAGASFFSNINGYSITRNGYNTVKSVYNAVQENITSEKKLDRNTKIQSAEVGMSFLCWIGLAGLTLEPWKKASKMKKAIAYSLIIYGAVAASIFQIGILEGIRYHLNHNKSKSK